LRLPLGPRCAADPGSSRPPRTGSIAACRPGSRCRARRGRPVRQGRAPLRPDARRVEGWRYGGRPVRQGRAPLRPDRPDHARHRARRVVPSAKDGLHCGCHIVLDGIDEVLLVVPSAKDGLHCGGAGLLIPTTTATRRPVRQGRAPLRPGTTKTVRHCTPESSRPPRTGSIAALSLLIHNLKRVARRPVRQGRAPLRPHPGMNGGERRPESSRPPRTGSIAAGFAARRGAGPRRVVPSAKDGLHCGAASACAFDGGGACGSSRPPRTGSIAAHFAASQHGYR